MRAAISRTAKTIKKVFTDLFNHLKLESGRGFSPRPLIIKKNRHISQIEEPSPSDDLLLARRPIYPCNESSS